MKLKQLDNLKKLLNHQIGYTLMSKQTLAEVFAMKRILDYELPKLEDVDTHMPINEKSTFILSLGYHFNEKFYDFEIIFNSETGEIIKIYAPEFEDDVFSLEYPFL